MRGYIHSIQSLGTVDGPGVRTVVFGEGCPLRCAYCHNPDTWECREGDLCGASELAERIFRLYPYIKDGGVTFSGGEPCAQAEFFCELASTLRERGLHIALDTCGAIYNESVGKLLSLVDLVLLDVKMTGEEDYRKYTSGSLEVTLEFLDRLEKMGKATWIRHVVVPTINDSEDNIRRLCELLRGYKCVKKIELLPFKKLCTEKYKTLGIPFLFEHIPAMNEKRIEELSELLS